MIERLTLRHFREKSTVFFQQAEMTMRLLEKLNSGEVGIKIDQEELREFEKRISSENYKKLAVTIISSIIFALSASYFLQYSVLNFHFSVGTFGVVLLGYIVVKERNV